MRKANTVGAADGIQNRRVSRKIRRNTPIEPAHRTLAALGWEVYAQLVTAAADALSSPAERAARVHFFHEHASTLRELDRSTARPPGTLAALERWLHEGRAAHYGATAGQVEYLNALPAAAAQLLGFVAPWGPAAVLQTHRAYLATASPRWLPIVDGGMHVASDSKVDVVVPFGADVPYRFEWDGNERRAGADVQAQIRSDVNALVGRQLPQHDARELAQLARPAIDRARAELVETGAFVYREAKSPDLLRDARWLVQRMRGATVPEILASEPPAARVPGESYVSTRTNALARLARVQVRQ